MYNRAALAVPIIALLAGEPRAASAQICTPGWRPAFSTLELQPDLYSGPEVYAQQAFDDDGPGPRPPALYIGGVFTRGDIHTLARWDGSTLQPIEGALTAPPSQRPIVQSMAVFDPDGASPAASLLVVAGNFDHAANLPVRGIATWDGHAWAALPGLPLNSYEFASNVKVLDPDGPGPAAPMLFLVGGSYTGFGVDSRLFAWDGTTWTTYPSPGGGIRGLDTFDPDGDGPLPTSVYVSYNALFGYSVPSFTVSGLARLSGVTWEQIVRSVCDWPTSPDCPEYDTMARFDPDGAGPARGALILHGRFEQVNGVAAHNIAAYDGAGWSAIGSGMDGALQALFAAVDPITGRSSVYASGQDLVANGIPLYYLGRYDATGWSPVPGVTGQALSAASFAGLGQLPALYFSGLDYAGSPVTSWGRLTSYGWSPIGQTLNNEVHTLATYAPPGQASTLYAGGAFTVAAGQAAVSLARWNGSSWQGIPGLNNHVDCLTTFGDSLALGGKFTFNGLPTGGVALYSPSAGLQPLATGMNTPVHALASFNNNLYAGGEFTTAGGVTAVGIARWDGAWHAVGTGVNNHVDALAVYDDGLGGGPALYIGGKFTSAAGLPTGHLARWNGSSWSVLPGGTVNGNIYALTVADLGDGPALYLGGDFSQSGPFITVNLARYRAGAFAPVGGGCNDPVRALSAYDLDGPGPAPALLLVGGDATNFGPIYSPHIAAWDGSTWQALATNLDGHVLAIAPFDPDGSGPEPTSAFLGGSFIHADGDVSPFIAQWTRCPTCYANCDQSSRPPILNIADFICFQSLFASGSPAANCDGSTASPILNVADFICFQQAFAAGCP